MKELSRRQLFSCIEAVVRAERAQSPGNDYQGINDLSLSRAQKEMALEWYAHKIWVVKDRRYIDEREGRDYDPLTIVDNVAHSHVFDLGDGENHREFNNLPEVELWLDEELYGLISERTPLVTEVVF